MYNIWNMTDIRDAAALVRYLQTIWISYNNNDNDDEQYWLVAVISVTKARNILIRYILRNDAAGDKKLVAALTGECRGWLVPSFASK